MMKSVVRLAYGLFVAAGLGACGCHTTDRGPDSAMIADADDGSDAPDAARSGLDAPVDELSATDGEDSSGSDALFEVGGADVAGCFSLFHVCGTTSDCCDPYRCLNITGELECQLEGPAIDAF